MLCRPQDIFPPLSEIRPALTIGLLTGVLSFFGDTEPGRKMFFDSTQAKLFVALILIMIIGIPFSYYPRASFNMIFTKYSSTILFFFLFLKIVDSTGKLKKILFISSVGTGVYSIWAIIEGDYSGYRRIFIGAMFDPNDLAFFTLSFLPFNFLFLSRRNALLRRLICSVNLISGSLLLLMTGSRGGIIAFAIATVIFFAGKTKTINLRSKLLFAALCVLFVSFNASRINFERYETIENMKEDYNYWDETGRISIWKTGFRMMVSHPLTGVGVTCFNEAIARDREARGLPPRWQAPHSMLIQFGAETGIFGLVLFVWMSVNAFRIFKRARERSSDDTLLKISEMARVGLIGHLISGMFLSQAYSVYWVFFIVLSATINRFMKTEVGGSISTWGVGTNPLADEGA